MVDRLKLEQLYKDIHVCRKCKDVISSTVQRQTNQSSCRSDILLMAQGPSENGVRKSGVHWVDKDGLLRPPGGVFLDKYLKQLGYSIDQSSNLPRPYTTNVLHCWTGKKGKRDREPTTVELLNCKQWWIMEVELVKPLVVILLGKPAAESFSAVCGEVKSFEELLHDQGEEITFGEIVVRRFTIPHPTAPYVGKSLIYEEVFKSITEVLRGQ